MYHIQYNDTPYRRRLGTRCKFQINDGNSKREPSKCKRGRNLGQNFEVLSPVRNLGDQLGNTSRTVF